MKAKQPHGPPMTLGNMRALGVRGLAVHCLNPRCLLSAIRVGLMDLRFAKTLGPGGSFMQRETAKTAPGTDFDVFATGD